MVDTPASGAGAFGRESSNLFIRTIYLTNTENTKQKIAT